MRPQERGPESRDLAASRPVCQSALRSQPEDRCAPRAPAGRAGPAGNLQVGVVGPDNTAEIRSVKVGPRVGTFWVIDGGLKPGERVIVAGLQNVRAGAVVKAAPVDAEPAGAGGQPGAASTKGAPDPTGAASQRHPSN